MSTNAADTDSRIAREPDGLFRTDSTAHSKDDALSERQFERLYGASYRLDDDYFELETRLILLLAGRMGLRAGEIVHMRESWIDWQDEMIRIPRWQPCEKGRDGGPCGHCRQMARQMVECNDDLSLEEALAKRWSPKTASGARELPFDRYVRVGLALEDYFDRYDEFMASQTAVNRRVNRLAEMVEVVDSETTYPHCLRATAATELATELDAIGLKQFMGWAGIEVALRYIQESGRRTRRMLRA